MMRGATARLIEVTSTLHFPASEKMRQRSLCSLDDSIKHPTEAISLAAVAGLRALAASYFPYPFPPPSPSPPSVDPTTLPSHTLVGRYMKPLGSDPNAALRRGYALALGSLPRGQLEGEVGVVVDALICASRMESNAELRDPLARRNAVRAVVQVARTVGLAADATTEGAGEEEGKFGEEGWRNGKRKGGVSVSMYSRIGEAVLSALGDYETDNRGDVGSWVREEAIVAMYDLLTLGFGTVQGLRKGEGKGEESQGGGREAKGEGEGEGAGNCEGEFERRAEGVGEGEDNGGEVTCRHAANERKAMAALLASLCERFVSCLVQQLLEKINRMREVAGLTLSRLLAHPQLPKVAHHAQLAALLTRAMGKERAGVRRPTILCASKPLWMSRVRPCPCMEALSLLGSLVVTSLRSLEAPGPGQLPPPRARLIFWKLHDWKPISIFWKPFLTPSSPHA